MSHAGAQDLLRRRAGVDPQRCAEAHQQGGVSARQLRQRQEPFHGRAAPDPAGQPGGPRNPRAGPGHPEAQRVARRQEVSAGAVSHDRCRTTWSRAFWASMSSSSAACSPRCADPAGLCVGDDHQAGGSRAGQTTETSFSSSGSMPVRRGGAAAGAIWRPPGTRRRSRPRRRGAAQLGTAFAAGEHCSRSVATSHAEVISHRGGNFVRFDKGLSLISKHATSLGYDALILFLDELILWLAIEVGGPGFRQARGSQADKPGGGPVGRSARSRS